MYIRMCLHKVLTLHIRYINRTYTDVVARGPWPFQIFRISSHFVLQEAVSQTKYCCSPKIKHFDPPKILWAGHATAHVGI